VLKKTQDKCEIRLFIRFIHSTLLYKHTLSKEHYSYLTIAINALSTYVLVFPGVSRKKSELDIE
jgi:hypothetical protein